MNSNKTRTSFKRCLVGEFFSAENVAEYTAFVNRHLFMCGIWVVVLVLLIYTQIRILAAHIKKVTPNAATLMVNHENGVFVDVRSESLFSKGHIANSRNVSAQEIKEGKINLIANNKDNPVILVGKDKMDSDCFNCARILKKLGYTKVYTLEGGITQWASDNLPLSNKK
ncbi:MAG: rhodanese-like domain-containing protein [Succinivibrio sp.]|nr:rhodanese-like domain-containing protein [Succinivibrio sp.]